MVSPLKNRMTDGRRERFWISESSSRARLSEYSRRLEKRCEDASHSKALRAKSKENALPFRPAVAGLLECARVLASLCCDGAKAIVLLDV